MGICGRVDDKCARRRRCGLHQANGCQGRHQLRCELGIGRREHKEAQRAQGSAESALPREKHKKKSGPMTRGRFAIVPKATKVEFG